MCYVILVMVLLSLSDDTLPKICCPLNPSKRLSHEVLPCLPATKIIGPSSTTWRKSSLETTGTWSDDYSTTGISGEVLEATWVFRRGSGGNLGKSGEGITLRFGVICPLRICPSCLQNLSGKPKLPPEPLRKTQVASRTSPEIPVVE